MADSVTEIYERPYEFFYAINHQHCSDDRTPTAELVFSYHREWLCEAQNLCDKIIGFSTLICRDNQCPCYTCSSIMFIEDLHYQWDFQMEMSHLIAESKGGKFTLAIIFPICRKCNRAMQARLPCDPTFLQGRGINEKRSIAYYHNIQREEDCNMDLKNNYQDFISFLKTKAQQTDDSSSSSSHE